MPMARRWLSLHQETVRDSGGVKGTEKMIDHMFTLTMEPGIQSLRMKPP